MIFHLCDSIYDHGTYNCLHTQRPWAKLVLILCTMFPFILLWAIQININISLVITDKNIM